LLGVQTLTLIVIVRNCIVLLVESIAPIRLMLALQWSKHFIYLF